MRLIEKSHLILRKEQEINHSSKTEDWVVFFTISKKGPALRPIFVSNLENREFLQEPRTKDHQLKAA